MKTKIVKDLMIPLSEYATVQEDNTLYEAVLALERTQEEFNKQMCPHRAVMVVDKNRKVVGRLSQWDVLRALEPKYSAMGDPIKLSRAGFSPQFLGELMKQFSLWDKPLRDICTKAAKLYVRDFMYNPEEGEYLDESATLDTAVHAFIMGHHHSLIVTRDKEIVGVLMLPDVFQEISENIKACVL